jgi:hypothetical protein
VQRKAASLEFHSVKFRVLVASLLVELVHQWLLPMQTDVSVLRYGSVRKGNHMKKK